MLLPHKLVQLVTSFRISTGVMRWPAMVSLSLITIDQFVQNLKWRDIHIMVRSYPNLFL